MEPDDFVGVAEAAWRWVLDQVRWDDGPWIPAALSVPAADGPDWDRDGLHSGTGGLAHVLAEIRLGRSWTAEEQRLVDGIADRVRSAIPTVTDPSYFDGLVGSIGVLLGAVWARRHAVAGAEIARPDLVAAATSGAEHLLSLGDAGGSGFVVPRHLQRDHDDQDELTYSWCHGPTGTSLLFLALAHAGVADVASRSPLSWHRRCLHSVRTSGIPERRQPGFWDDDGRCCGTAGVGDVFADSWQRSGEDDDLNFAVALADTLVQRAVRMDGHACWRFLEHTAAKPLLPPGVGWAQGAAGIAAYLFRMGRLLRDGRGAATAPRMEPWWALPGASPAHVEP